MLPKAATDVVEKTLALSHSSKRDIPPAPIPTRVGRYKITGLLGEGSYGRVFKARDDRLQRDVAIKVPHQYRIASNSSRDRYLEEARTLAKLNHPNIVGVHDVGMTDDGTPYIVSVYIEGTDLYDRMQAEPLKLRDALALLIDIGRALNFVHGRRIVHRDIKPGNILLNTEGKPFLADFGLALRDQITTPARSRVGTLAYMSPEQARGESHLVDGRSDIFSLGVILYEMLAGQRPFAGDDPASILHSLLHQEARPLRQIQHSIPRELERICLKALSKQVSQRYSTVNDFVDDLEHFLNAEGSTSEEDRIRRSKKELMESEAAGGIIPRGLRSYDRHDKDFFCQLLPGPRDRQWVPESLRFWERQLSSPEVQDPPRIGVIYGPSGCGKSSFVKAGLLPLLGDSVVSVFVEATRQDTESRLLRGIQKRCPQVSAKDLAGTLAEVRANPGVAGGRRLLLVIDQFEQWLHGRQDQEDPELATALRQCDGQHVQCVLLVRDDFWLALSRFMSILEVPLRQNYNATLVDLFNLRHARRVLAEFGVAYDRLPLHANEYTPEQNLFLDRAVEELSDAGKVFPVRLALFVEMVKTQPWEIATLNRLGGVKGIGMQFLEEAFSSKLAPAAQRTHEDAVRRVLRKLLPEKGVHIKGNMQPESLLLEASGYQNQPAAFDEMLRILESDLRLVMPTDPAGSSNSEDSISQSGDAGCYYQLTHDFLVPAIEQWLTRKQQGTRRGRAELRLAEYSNIWSAKPTPRNAPSWLEWASIRYWTSSQTWTSVERKMMRAATRRHVLQTVVAVALLTTLLTTAWFFRSRSNATSAVDQLQTARTEQLDEILERIEHQRAFSRRPLRDALEKSTPGSRTELVNRLALMSEDDSQREVLLRRSLESELPMAMRMVLRSRLQPLNESERSLLIETLDNETIDSQQRLFAAMILAEQIEVASDDEPQDEEAKLWTRHAPLIADELLKRASVAPQDNNYLIAAFTPVASFLTPTLQQIAVQKVDSPSRSLATAFLMQFLDEDPGKLLEFFLDASFEQQDAVIATVEPRLNSVRDQIRKVAFSEIDESLQEEEYDLLARRKGIAAALLHRSGETDSTWSLLNQTSWPHARSYFFSRIAAIGGRFETILDRYPRESQVSVRRALLWALSAFEWDQVNESGRLQAVVVIRDAFENDPDVGIHSSAEHLLIKWGESKWLAEVIAAQSKLRPDPRKNWYVNGEGLTMAVFDARDVSGIGRVFAISTKEVSVEQFQRYSVERFNQQHRYYEERSPTPDCPIGLTDWFSAIDYCRWLTESLDGDVEHNYPKEIQRKENPEADYSSVEQHGAYRLPTSKEWEYACAAMTNSRRYYGTSDSLAGYFFRYYATSLNEDEEVRYYPGGSMLPNDFGMFAMYDGVREWGHDKLGERRSILGHASGQEARDAETFRSRHASDLPLANNGFYGLRVAKTVVESDR